MFSSRKLVFLVISILMISKSGLAKKYDKTKQIPYTQYNLNDDPNLPINEIKNDFQDSNEKLNLEFNSEPVNNKELTNDELNIEQDQDKLLNYDEINTKITNSEVTKLFNSAEFNTESLSSDIFQIEQQTGDELHVEQLKSDQFNTGQFNTEQFNKIEVNIQNATEETCIGDIQFCNLSKEEYVSMLNNYIYPQTYEWILIGTHSAVFVMGLIGNALVVIAVYRNHTMRTVTNYFIANLAVADFMVILFCLPPTVLWDVTETWFLGDALCKILLYFQSVSVTVSVLTLTFISVDRWYAICFPLEFKSTTGRAKTAILIIWTISLLFNAPDLVVLTTVKTVPLRFDLEYLVQCMPTWSAQSDLIWHIIKVVFIYSIPLLLMTVAYCQIVRVLWSSKKIPGRAETLKLASAEQTQLRSRRKAAKMLVAVVVIFAVCYFPVHLLTVLRYTMDMKQNDVVTCLALVSHILCYANSAVNPLIYNFMSGKFRREFRRSFCCSVHPSQETFTTMTRVTTSKRKPVAMTLSCRLGQPCRNHVCSTTFIENGYHHKNGYLT